jgi:uncharacterized membrane protein
MSRRAAGCVLFLSLVFGVLFVWHALARYQTFHNQTFDLAFYARMAWGIAHGSFWDPIVNAHFVGLHFAVILAPLGLLGRVFGTVPVLLVAQTLAVCAVAWPLSLLGARRFGDLGAVAAAFAWLLYPNIGHVVSDEFHPGTLATLPMAWAMYSIAAGHKRALIWATVCMVACRADLAWTAFMLGLLAWQSGTPLRRTGLWTMGWSAAYLLLFVLVIHPIFAPPQGSLQLHFGKWGNSAPEIARTLISSPGLVLGHFGEPKRLFYLPKLLAPVALLPLLRPRLLLVAAPSLLINLISDFPTATFMDCHYQTLAVPALVAAAIEGAAAFRGVGIQRVALALMAAASVVAHLIAGGMPWSRDYAAGDFIADANTLVSRQVVAVIPANASVQAPYRLMPHLAERLDVYRAPPPERNAEFVVLDVAHRVRFAGRGDLLRTFEEPEVRSWIARPNHAVVFAQGDLVVLQRGKAAREGLAKRYIVGRTTTSSGTPITECLSVLGAALKADTLTLDLVAAGPCPSDLALRIGSQYKPERQDLLFDGLLSPANLLPGDRLISRHRVSPAERRAMIEKGLQLGAVRESGARPNPRNPDSVQVPLQAR